MSRSDQKRQPTSAAIARIEKHLVKLPPQQQKIADFILKHPEETAFLSITKLAARAGVSQATVVRFCRSLGYKGFVQMNDEIQQSVQARMTTSSRFALAQKYRWQADDADAIPVLRRVVQKELSNIARIADRIDKTTFNRCLKQMAAADRIAVIGCISSAALAIFFANTLSKILPDVAAITHHGIEAQGVLKRLTGRSVIFAIAFPRYPTATVEITRAARESGAKIVALSNSHISPIMDLAHIRFVVPVSIHSYVDSYAGPITFLSSLAVGIGGLNAPKAEKGLSWFERYADNAGLFA